MAKAILLWDPRFPDRAPDRLLLDDAIASAAVRAGVAAAANPEQHAELAAGGAVSPADLIEVVLQHGAAASLKRVFLPTAVAIVAAGLGLAQLTNGQPLAAPAINFTFASADLAMPTGAMFSNNTSLTLGTSRYRYSKKRVYITEDLTEGKAVFYNGVFDYVAGVRCVTPTGNDQVLLRARFINAAGNQIVDINNPVGGAPLSSANSLTVASDAFGVCPFGAITAGEWFIELSTYIPEGGRTFSGHITPFVFRTGELVRWYATDQSGQASPPASTGTGDTFNACPTFSFIVGKGRRKSALVVGDSIEFGNGLAWAEGYDTPGPVRTALAASGGGGRCAFSACGASGYALPSVIGPVSGENLIQFYNRARIAVGSDCQLYTEVVSQFVRNASSTAIANTQTLADMVKALDPRTRVWCVTPIPFVQGTGYQGSNPASQYTNVADQVVASPQGAEITAYIAAILPGGSLRTSGAVYGALDHRSVSQAPTDPQKWKAGSNTIYPDALLKDVTLTNRIRMNVQIPPNTHRSFVINPGQPNQEGPFRVNIGQSIGNFGGGIYDYRTNISLTQSHSIDEPIVFTLGADGTHELSLAGQMANELLANGSKAALMAAPL